MLEEDWLWSEKRLDIGGYKFDLDLPRCSDYIPDEKQYRLGRTEIWPNETGSFSLDNYPSDTSNMMSIEEYNDISFGEECTVGQHATKVTVELLKTAYCHAELGSSSPLRLLRDKYQHRILGSAHLQALLVPWVY